MKSTAIPLLMLLAIASVAAAAQSLDDLNIQVHGYATQAFLYTTNNNILTTSSSDGSAAWTDAVVNVSSQPLEKLRIGVQARYFLLGNFGNAVTLDWAAADYRVNDRIGVRFGKVKTPSGLFNEVQDIDPSYIWALLPQSVYPISSRNSILAHYGGVAYGTFDLGHKLGKLEYRGWGGERFIDDDDGYFVNEVESGIVPTQPFSGVTFGGALHWKTPVRGLMLGVSNTKNQHFRSPLSAANGFLTGEQVLRPQNDPDYFATYERHRLMVAVEATRLPVSVSLDFVGVPPTAYRVDYREGFAMSSYKITEKLTAGVYYSQFFNRQLPLGSTRYQKDWALSARYDFNQFLYAKFEQHFMDGTALGFDMTLNPDGLKPDTRFTILKAGVSF